MKPKLNFCKTLLALTFLLAYSSSIFSQIQRDTLVFADFDDELLPTDWTIVDDEGNGNEWVFDNARVAPFNPGKAIFDAYFYPDAADVYISTPAIDLSSYTSSVQIFLNFDFDFLDNNSPLVVLEVFNGTTWVVLREYEVNFNYPNTKVEFINLTDYVSGVSNAQVRVRYTGINDGIFAFDNFVLFTEYTDADQDGIVDINDADADNDGIPNSVEGSCSAFDLIFENHWTAGQDPVTNTPSSPLVFGNTTVELDRRDPENIIFYGTTPAPDNEEGTGIASQNSIQSYKIMQNSTAGDSSEHVFKFSQPVSGLVFGVVDIDMGTNFIDSVIIDGYAGDTIYTIRPQDAYAGLFARFNEDANSFTGKDATISADAISRVHFPVLIDSVVVTYLNIGNNPSAYQAIIFNASFTFCDTKDTDNDRIADYIDLDSDNDGIPDLIEIGGVDLDGDGRVDNAGDVDQDGLATIFDTDDNDPANEISNLLTNGGLDAKNSDTDTIPDYLDLDADNDGISDIIEAGGIDMNGDGYVDGLASTGRLTDDMDNDGFTDAYDPDNDGTLGVDAGADQEPLVETDATGKLFNGETGTSRDTDADGLPDHLDLDADNDGIPDLVEAGGIDTNGDGRVDTIAMVAFDADKDGYADVYDTDDDGTVGVEDATDALLQTTGTDTDADGKAETTDAITFNNGAGNNKDTDSDGRIDGLDLDADNDGIPDFVESGATDLSNTGMVNTAAFPWDADGDGLADVYDEDANDGPASAGGNANGVALVETTADTNDDGIVNNTEAMANGGGGNNNINADQDAYANHLDLDADNDGITDVVENAGGLTNADNTTGTLDGIVGDNSNVTDSDTNGWHDPSNSSTTDTDGDMIPDFLDKDADNDGIVDYLEGVCSTCPTFAAPTGGDSDGDGVLDFYENMSSDNTDNTTGSNTGTTPNLDDDDLVDTTPDYLDTDTDEDGAFDWVEGYDFNNNGNAYDDIVTMAATYESNNADIGHYPTTDSDSDNLPDWLDNQPNVAGYDANLRPPFLDASNPAWKDTDNDGLVAIFDTDEQGTMAPTPDNNGAADRDWRDQTAAVALPVELVKFSAKNQDCSIVLEWVTASEEKFSHFEIERSIDGVNFKTLQSIASIGGSSANIYRYKDQNIQSGMNYYYRLKMVDLDESFEFSKIISLTAACKALNFAINMYPNPIGFQQSELTLELEANERDLQVNVVDMVGKIWFEGVVERNEQLLKIDVARLPVGTYNVLINDNGTVVAERFVKMN